MFGHKWEPAEGTVVESRYDHGGRTPNEERVYVVDVRRPDGTTTRAEIRALSFMRAELAPGTVVGLEAHSKTGELRFDQHHPVKHSPSSHGGQAAAQGGIAAALAGLAQAAAQGRLGPDTPGVHIISQGSEVRVSGGAEVTMVSGEDTAELIHALRAGGSERAAAVARLRQLKADMAARSGHEAGTPGHFEPAAPAQPEGFNSGTGPSTFDQVSSPPPVTPVTPVMPESPVAFGTAGTGGTGGVAGGFGTAGGSFAAPGGSFGGSFGQEDKATRIARLEQQRNAGQLTEEQFAEQRQRILDEF